MPIRFKKTIVSWFIVFLGLINLAHGQHLADQLFEKNNFDDAYSEYLSIAESELTLEQRYRMAVCVLNSHDYSKKPAIDILTSYLSLKPFDGNAHYLLGRALAYEGQFDLAEKEFTYCLTASEISNENKQDAGHQLDYVQSARVLFSYQLQVTFEKASSAINTDFDEYYPFIDSTESVLYFNSRRNEGSIEKPDGHCYSNVFYSVAENGVFTKAQPLEGKINVPDMEEEIVGLSLNGKKAIFSIEDKDGNTDLIIGNLNKGKVVSFEKMPKGVNTIHHEIAATFGKTTNEIYFASDRPGGFGGIDLYVIRKNPKGKWSKPQNLGPEINTIYDEDFPNLSHDGKFLFFSSKGHSSIGGYDIFKASWDENVLRFIKPVNVGCPVNTLYDDMNLNFSGNERYGYVTRNDEKSALNIYRVTFEQVEPELSIVIGKIETGKKEGELLEGILIVVENLLSGEISGEYLPNPNTMRYVMALSPGKYKITIDVDGFDEYEENIEIKGQSAFVPEIEHHFTLKRKE